MPPLLLRLVFDNPRDPDFELVLWPPADPARAPGAAPLAAIQAGRRWVSSVEAILRQVPPPAPPAPPRSPEREPVIEDDDDPEPPWDEDEDER